MPKFYSSDGNMEVWESIPDGYFTVDQWKNMHPEENKPGSYYDWDGEKWIINHDKKNSGKSKHIRIKRRSLLLCAFDSKEKYEREQVSISKGISISTPMLESDYILVLQYLQDLFDMPQQSGFPWNGSDDPECPWPVKPDCVLDTSLV